MRVGGNTQDSTWFDPNLSTDLVVERSLKTLQESVTLGPLAFENLNNISSCIPINWIIGLNFNESLVTDPENALMMAQAAQRSLGCNLYAFEIGNEPDNFVALKQRGPGWNIQKYVNEWISYEHKLQQAVPAIADHGLEAAVFGSGWRVADLLYYKTQNTTFIRRFQSQIRGISKHDYQTSNCNPKYIPTIQDLLNHTKIDNNIKYAVSGIKQSDMINKSVRMGEFNSISCQGRDGVSNTFASALWAIDYMVCRLPSDSSYWPFYLLHPLNQRCYWHTTILLPAIYIIETLAFTILLMETARVGKLIRFSMHCCLFLERLEAAAEIVSQSTPWSAIYRIFQHTGCIIETL